MVFPQPVSGVRKHSALGSGDGLSGGGGWPNEEVQEMLTCLLDVGVEEGGGRGPRCGVISEAHSTLIHKVGNTTPSSAVSSAFYFMGDCTVCLSVHGDSSGHLLLFRTPALIKAPSSHSRFPPYSLPAQGHSGRDHGHSRGLIPIFRTATSWAVPPRHMTHTVLNPSEAATASSLKGLSAQASH